MSGYSSIENGRLGGRPKYNNQAKIMYVIFEKLFIKTAQALELNSIDLDLEEQKLALAAKDGELSRLL